MPALAAIAPARTGQAIVGPENDRATALDFNRFAGLQNSPADGTVADIEADMQIGICPI